MEFGFDINPLFPEEITHFEARTLKFALKKDPELSEDLKIVIDKIGRNSSASQGLPYPVTLFHKFLISDCDLFVLKDGDANDGLGAILGYLKVGTKDLYLHDSRENLIKTRPLCVLDFYIHESKQRRGCGKRLFDFMLSRTKDGRLKPCHVAFDRPSNKLGPFLNKHYGLTDYLPQYNQFLIVPGFFKDNPCQSEVGGNGTSKFFPYPKNLPRRPVDDVVLANFPTTAPMESLDAAPRPATTTTFNHFPVSANDNNNAQLSSSNAESLHAPVLKAEALRFSRHALATSSRGPESPRPIADSSEKESDELDVQLTRSPSPECLPNGSDESKNAADQAETATPEIVAKRDWTKVDRKPLGSSVSNPAGSNVRNATAANSLIWTSSSSSSNYRVRAPYATISSKADLLALSSELSMGMGSLPEKRNDRNPRFKRTSLW